MTNIDLLDYIRPYDPIRDKNLKEFSHSKLEYFETCPYQFDLKYNQHKVSNESTIALELGSLLHLALEYKGKMLVNDKVDYKFLENLIKIGGPSDDGHGNAIHIAGIDELKKRYFEIWNVADSEGRTYNDKIDNFMNVLHTEMEEDNDWTPVYFEHPFRYVLMDRIVVHGFIDRIDTREGENGTEYRLIDYKTSKKIYDSSKTATSQQFALYELAILNEFGILASECLYRFICINDSQTALTKNWEKRFITKITKVLDQIDECYKTGIWAVSPKPLCHWCSFSATNPDAHKYKRECEYYSDWTPTNKVYTVHKEWNPEKKDEPKRKLKFDF